MTEIKIINLSETELMKMSKAMIRMAGRITSL